MTIYYVCRDPVIVDESTAALTQTIQHYGYDYDGDWESEYSDKNPVYW